MKKKELIISYGIVMNGCALALFTSSLINLDVVKTLVGFVLLIGFWVIKYQSGVDKKTKKIPNGSYGVIEDVDNSSRVNVVSDCSSLWERFIIWLKS